MAHMGFRAVLTFAYRFVMKAIKAMDEQPARHRAHRTESMKRGVESSQNQLRFTNPEALQTLSFDGVGRINHKEMVN